MPRAHTPKLTLPPQRPRAFTVSPYRVPAFCPLCFSHAKLPPIVVPYVAEMDLDGKAARMTPGWAETGYLAVWACRRCGHQHMVPATAEEVQQWGEDSPRGWHLY